MQDTLDMSIPDKILFLVVLLKRKFSSAGRITRRPDSPKNLISLILYFSPNHLFFQESHTINYILHSQLCPSYPLPIFKMFYKTNTRKHSQLLHSSTDSKQLIRPEDG